MVPKLYGQYESSRARIRYAIGEVEEDMQPAEEDIRQGFSSSLGRVRIISTAEYIQSTSYYLKEWGIYSAIVIVTTFVPLFVWLSTRSAADKYSKKKSR